MARLAAFVLVLFALTAGQANAVSRGFNVYVVDGQIPAGAEGAMGLLVPGAGPETSRELALASLLRGEAQNSLRGDLPLSGQEIVLTPLFGDPPKPPYILVSLPKGGTQKNDKRYRVLVVAPGYRGILVSDSTRIPGLVSIADIAPTALGEDVRRGALARDGDRPLGVDGDPQGVREPSVERDARDGREREDVGARSVEVEPDEAVALSVGQGALDLPADAGADAGHLDGADAEEARLPDEHERHENPSERAEGDQQRAAGGDEPGELEAIAGIHARKGDDDARRPRTRPLASRSSPGGHGSDFGAGARSPRRRARRAVPPRARAPLRTAPARAVAPRARARGNRRSWHRRRSR